MQDGQRRVIRVESAVFTMHGLIRVCLHIPLQHGLIAEVCYPLNISLTMDSLWIHYRILWNPTVSLRVVSTPGAWFRNGLLHTLPASCMRPLQTMSGVTCSLQRSFEFSCYSNSTSRTSQATREISNRTAMLAGVASVELLVPPSLGYLTAYSIEIAHDNLASDLRIVARSSNDVFGRTAVR